MSIKKISLRVYAVRIALVVLLLVLSAALDPKQELKAADSTDIAQRLSPSNITAGESFGYCVSISGNTAVVGCENSSIPAAYVFVRNGNSWEQQAEIIASDPTFQSGFGMAVAISGDTLVIGAPYKNQNSGAIYVFSRNGETWSQEAELFRSNPQTGDLFGYTAGIDGDTVVVTAPGATVRGSAYVFVRNGVTWTEQALLQAGGITNFGCSVSISGNTITVGADYANNMAGIAYVFEREGVNWELQQSLTGNDTVASDLFGESVSVSGDTLVAAAPGSSTHTGAIYIFARNGSVWSQKQKITSNEALIGDQFGYSVAISGNKMVVGAAGKNDWTGAAYTFNYRDGTWNQRTKLTASDSSHHDYFGYFVAIDNENIIVGAPAKNTSTGAAYIAPPHLSISADDDVSRILQASQCDFRGDTGIVLDITTVTGTQALQDLENGACDIAGIGFIPE